MDGAGGEGSTQICNNRKVQVINGTKYTAACDVYSLGICLWEVLSRRVPYAGMNKFAIILSVTTKNTRPNEQPNCPPELDALMKLMWAHDAALRPTADKVHRQLSQLVPMFPDGNIREK